MRSQNRQWEDGAWKLRRLCPGEVRGGEAEAGSRETRWPSHAWGLFLLLREGLPSWSGHQRTHASDKFNLTAGSLPVLSCPAKARLNLSFRRELPVIQVVAWPPLPEVVSFSLFFQECWWWQDDFCTFFGQVPICSQGHTIQGGWGKG